ncbi:MAG: hypothetical protein NTW54_06235 [Bacteroidetes bacterium]|nr:hypothetical protein [Bacteroidota bacterium]
MKPRMLSLLVSLIISALLFIASLFLLDNWQHAGILSVIVFLSCFVLFIMAIEVYLSKRISLVYKLISNLKIDKDLKQALDNKISDDPLNQIEREVSQLAQRKAIEIDTRK